MPTGRPARAGCTAAGVARTRRKPRRARVELAPARGPAAAALPCVIDRYHGCAERDAA